MHALEKNEVPKLLNSQIDTLSRAVYISKLSLRPQSTSTLYSSSASLPLPAPAFLSFINSTLRRCYRHLNMITDITSTNHFRQIVSLALSSLYPTASSPSDPLPAPPGQCLRRRLSCVLVRAQHGACHNAQLAPRLYN